MCKVFTQTKRSWHNLINILVCLRLFDLKWNPSLKSVSKNWKIFPNKSRKTTLLQSQRLSTCSESLWNKSVEWTWERAPESFNKFEVPTHSRNNTWRNWSLWKANFEPQFRTPLPSKLPDFSNDPTGACGARIFIYIF